VVDIPWPMRDTDEDATDPKLFWELGVPLRSAYEAFAVNSDRFAFTALRTKPEDDSGLCKKNPVRYEEITRHGWLPASFEDRKRKLKGETQKQRVYLLQGLYHGKLLAVGKHTLADGSDAIERVPEEYFLVDINTSRPFAKIGWTKGEVRIDSDDFLEVRVILPLSEYTFRGEKGVVDVRLLTKSMPTTVPPVRISKPGRPSKKGVIRHAIANHAKQDPKLRQPPVVRRRNYRAYISQHGYDLRQDSGFTNSTFEKYETEYRNKNK
jgi:hypothetical protein